MSNPNMQPSEDDNTSFEEIIETMTTLEPMEKPDFFEQCKLLDEVNKSYTTEWINSEIISTANIAEYWNNEAYKIKLRKSHLKHHDEPTDINNSIAELSLTVEQRIGPAARVNIIDVPVAQIYNGTLLPIGEFSQDQAILVSNQVRELEGFKKDGMLPDLSADLTYIFDISTGLQIKNDKTD